MEASCPHCNEPIEAADSERCPHCGHDAEFPGELEFVKQPVVGGDEASPTEPESSVTSQTPVPDLEHETGPLPEWEFEAEDSAPELELEPAEPDPDLPVPVEPLDTTTLAESLAEEEIQAEIPEYEPRTVTHVAKSPVAPAPMRPTLPDFSWRQVGQLSGWILSMGLVLSIAYGSVRVEPSAGAAVPTLVIGELATEQVRGRWIENALEGEIFVVSGLLRNHGGSEQILAGELQVVLLDEAGDRLPLRTIAAPALSQHALREQPLSQLQALTERSASSLSVREVAPGREVRFDAVVGRPPAQAASFELEIVSRR